MTQIKAGTEKSMMHYVPGYQQISRAELLNRSEQKGQFDESTPPFGLQVQACALGKLLDDRVVAKGSVGHGNGKEVEALDHQVTFLVHIECGGKFCLLYDRDSQHIHCIGRVHQNKGICKDRKRRQQKS